MTQHETEQDAARAHARLDDLEMKTAFQERLLSDLNDELVQHGQRISQMEKQLKELKKVMEHLSALAEKSSTPEVDERPPHY